MRAAAGGTPLSNDHSSATSFEQFHFHGLSDILVQSRMQAVSAHEFVTAPRLTYSAVDASLRFFGASPRRLLRGGCFQRHPSACSCCLPIFHPAAGFVRAWSVASLVLTLTYVAILEPIFVAFNAELADLRQWPSVVDLVCGAFFAADVIVNFRTGIFYVTQVRTPRSRPDSGAPSLRSALDSSHALAQRRWRSGAGAAALMTRWL